MRHQEMSVEQFKALTGRGKQKPPAAAAIQVTVPAVVGTAPEVLLELPLPPKALHPNSRPAHWSQRSRAAKKARADAALALKASGVEALPLRATIHATFYLRREMDDDGLSSWLKSYRDGLFPEDSAVTMLAPSVILVGKDEQPRVVLRIQAAKHSPPPI